MSATELAARAVAGEERSLCGWGGVAATRATVIRPRDAEQVAGALAAARSTGTNVIARGAGRSYGDAAQSAGGWVLDMTGWDRILSVDAQRGLITAQAGATVAALLAALSTRGLTLPVVPGTRHVTLAGAIAGDVHGKNHHRDGGLARHVVALTLCTPADGCIELTPDAEPDLFSATLGGMGLTGVVLQATLAAEPLTSRWLVADVDRVEGLAQALELMRGSERRYCAAWLDLLAPSPDFGRGIVSGADPLPASAPASARRPPSAGGLQWLGRARALEVPRRFPGALLRPVGVRAFNALRWRAAPRHARERPLPAARYLFPLDGLGEWYRLYGPGGLIQYQVALPDGEESALVRCVELMRARRLPIYLAVLKRLGASFGGPLSFPLAGWTLAVDMPAAAAGVRPALDELDELVAAHGGRVYLSKDVRMRRDVLGAMYPQLERFAAQRRRADPDGVLSSDLSRRLGLDEAQG
jgi:decaprenylphospho-beta-D-ribofuranose 2-oxidase